MDLQQIIREVVPGSVWLRTDGAKARVIAVTNLSLSAEQQKKYVPHVVYVGQSGKVFSRPLKDFAGYFPTWIGFDRAAEKTIESLVTPLNAPKREPEAVPENAEDTEIDMSLEAPVVSPAREKPVVQVREKSALAVVASTGDYNDLVNRPAPPPVLLRAAFQLGNNDQLKTPLVTADQLSNAIRVYSQVPDEHLGLVVHKLSFELSPKLTIDMLKEVFQPDALANTVDVFRIGTPVSDETVGVDAYMGVYPEFSRNVLYGTVYIGADMIPATPVVEHTHAEVSQSTTTRADEVPAVTQEEPVPEVSVQDSPEVAENVEQPAPDQATPSESVSSTGKEASVTPEAIPAEDGASKDAASAKKPRKKRTPKKKVVSEPIVADDDLDVANLS